MMLASFFSTDKNKFSVHTKKPTQWLNVRISKKKDIGQNACAHN